MASKRIPEYLKLHTEDGEGRAPASPSNAPAPDLATALSMAMGWEVQWRSPTAAERQAGQSTPPALTLVERPGALPQPRCTPRPIADQLLIAVNDLVAKLHESLRALERSEAELAAGVPVAPRADESQHLAERLEAILRGGAEAVRAHAAALYLLDELTSHLKLRAAWGLPAEKLTEPARPLRGAVADLEALVGHAVVLEDARLLRHWHPPEDYPSAVCIPVATPTTPIGTLWVFSQQRRDFDDRETQMLEIVAGRIASELEREMLLHEAVHSKQWQREIERLTVRQQQRNPSFAPLLDQWDFAGWSSPAQGVSTEFFDWGVVRDGRPYIALGTAEGKSLEGAMISAALHASLKAHLAHQQDPRDVLAAINETFWSGSTGDQFASMFYTVLEPERRVLEYAFAGRTHAFIVGSRGTRPLTQPAAPLGMDPDTAFPTQRTRLHQDELLVIAGTGVVKTGDAHEHPLSIERLGEALRKSPAPMTAVECIESLRQRVLDQFPEGTTPEITIVVARPRQP